MFQKSYARTRKLNAESGKLYTRKQCIPAKHPNSSMRTPQEQVQMQVLLKEQTQVEQHCLDQIQQAPVSVALILAVCIRRSNSGGLKTSWQVYSPGAPICSWGPCIAWVVFRAPESQKRPLQPRQTVLQKAEQRYRMALLCQQLAEKHCWIAPASLQAA